MMTNDYESKIAIQNAHCISDEDAYFNARPQLDNHDRRKVFQSGHRMGFEAAHASQQARIDALEAKLAEVSKDAIKWYGVIFAVEQSIQNGSCPIDIESEYEDAIKKDKQ